MFGGGTIGVNGSTTVGMDGGGLAGGMTYNRAAQDTGNAPSLQWSVWVIAALVILYAVWAAIEQHQRVQEAVKPGNIALNFRNLAVIGLSAVLGLVLLKVLWTKLAALGIPGAAAVNQVVGAA